MTRIHFKKGGGSLVEQIRDAQKDRERAAVREFAKRMAGLMRDRANDADARRAKNRLVGRKDLENIWVGIKQAHLLDANMIEQEAEK